MYLILAPYDNEQCDLLQRVKETEQMDDLPIYMYVLWFDLLLAYYRMKIVEDQHYLFNNPSFPFKLFFTFLLI